MERQAGTQTPSPFHVPDWNEKCDDLGTVLLQVIEMHTQCLEYALERLLKDTPSKVSVLAVERFSYFYRNEVQKVSKKTPKPAPQERYSILPKDGPKEAALRVRDRTVLEYDARWGTDVLPTLVSAETAVRFARVRDRLDAQLKAADEAVDVAAYNEAVDLAVNTMAVEMRGLAKLEEEALAAGRKPLDPGRVWALQLADGTQAAIVQTDADAHALRRAERAKGWAIYSIRELSHLLSERALLGVLDAKKAFPEATVEAVKPAVDWRKGDEVPF